MPFRRFHKCHTGIVPLPYAIANLLPQCSPRHINEAGDSFQRRFAASDRGVLILCHPLQRRRRRVGLSRRVDGFLELSGRDEELYEIGEYMRAAGSMFIVFPEVLGVGEERGGDVLHLYGVVDELCERGYSNGVAFLGSAAGH
eukprot:CAMPEP_0175893418 /NCGR_PEP_ID=MMETSP0107_2-20121207/49454_1 /TAXON_ID=195067 ORGANISM="Goniomonas pacifica, Strain CCMP1869" /NCGR_SAMPLE_ID=MMETSP0107_2 /ASSEMBLY_ACC=CAM_ASM_000203 /LENGTH=142 /DNA_ID=CAMNT_0017214455 /DNA_START=146 /DNA_END=574 /DNA_ORIENTATION=-